MGRRQTGSLVAGGTPARRRTLASVRRFGVVVAGCVVLGAPVGEGYAQAAADTVRRASPRGAMLRSLVVPGWGQWYNGKPVKALLVAGVQLALAGGLVHQHRRFTETGNDAFRDRRNALEWYLGLSALLSMADAYVDAYLDRFDENMQLSVAPLAGGGGRVGLWLRL